MRGIGRHSISAIGLDEISRRRTARLKIRRSAWSPTLSDESANALPGRRTDPPGARLASRNASIASVVMAVIGKAPKAGRRCCSANEA